MSVQDVMEKAVTQYGPAYRFSTTYFGADLGYFIDKINGTESNSPCYWLFYFKGPYDEKATLSPAGVTNFFIPGDNYAIIFCYAQSAHAECPECPKCPELK